MPRGECADLPKELQRAHGWTLEQFSLTQEQLGGARAAALQRRLHGRERESNSAGRRAQGTGIQPRIRLPPGQAEAGRAQDSKDAPAPS